MFCSWLSIHAMDASCLDISLAQDAICSLVWLTESLGTQSWNVQNSGILEIPLLPNGFLTRMMNEQRCNPLTSHTHLRHKTWSLECGWSLAIALHSMKQRLFRNATWTDQSIRNQCQCISYRRGCTCALDRRMRPREICRILSVSLCLANPAYKDWRIRYIIVFIKAHGISLRQMWLSQDWLSSYCKAMSRSSSGKECWVATSQNRVSWTITYLLVYWFALLLPLDSISDSHNWLIRNGTPEIRVSFTFGLLRLNQLFILSSRCKGRCRIASQLKACHLSAFNESQVAIISITTCAIWDGNLAPFVPRALFRYINKSRNIHSHLHSMC